MKGKELANLRKRRIKKNLKLYSYHFKVKRDLNHNKNKNLLFN